MGWSSAGELFNIAVEWLQDRREDEVIQHAILSNLAHILCSLDWDTMYESLEAFPDNPAVVRLMDEMFELRLPCKCCEHGED